MEIRFISNTHIMLYFEDRSPVNVYSSNALEYLKEVMAIDLSEEIGASMASPSMGKTVILDSKG
jgi:hypothetical protein